MQITNSLPQVATIKLHSLSLDQARDSETKLDGTRVKLGYEMRCEAGSNIDEREIENS